jgi:hypothetical protein
VTSEQRKKRQEEIVRGVFQEWMAIGNMKTKEHDIVCYMFSHRIVVSMAWHKGLLGTAKRIQFFEEIIGDGSWL